MSKLDDYYNKFNEDKRLTRRHGMIEYIISMDYIHRYIPKDKKIKIIDIGAGTGRYSVPLSEEGHDVTAVELVKTNLGKLKVKKSNVKAFQGTATNLKKFEDDYFDIAILFGPMYHLLSYDEKLQALKEAKRVTKKGGYIFVAYVMNEYAILTYGFKEKHILECVSDGRFDSTFRCNPSDNDLYDYVRLEDINKLNEDADIKRVKIISPDGPANHMRQILNSLSDEEFDMFVKYQMSVCERMDLIGASAHTVDILQK
ncbi:MAG: class I SAM-dependent methyltransferase [Lachnospiraceae bacterium]|nr:class I SAM-dependent methyltransferase [Lachnospiraceae bacterium]